MVWKEIADHLDALLLARTRVWKLLAAWYRCSRLDSCPFVMTEMHDGLEYGDQNVHGR